MSASSYLLLLRAHFPLRGLHPLGIETQTTLILFSLLLLLSNFGGGTLPCHSHSLSNDLFEFTCLRGREDT